VKAKHTNLARRATVLALVLICATTQASAADLTPAAKQAYDRYVQLTVAQTMQQIAQPATYLWINHQSAADRQTDEQTLRDGKLVIAQMETLDNGKAIDAPSALIHHWVGTVFVPGVTLDQTLAFMQDYDHKVDYFKPDILTSKILKQNGGDYTVHLRFYQKKVVSTVIDTDQEIHYQRVDATHAWSRSHTTRVQEVSNAGAADEKLEPAGHDHGYVWRMDTIWRFEEKDGGTYVECQAMSLSRDIPTGLGWMVSPFVKSVPKESLTFTLETARNALMKKASQHN
jgi:hypothetical protein